MNSKQRKGEVQGTEPGKDTNSGNGEKLSADRSWGLGGDADKKLGPNCVGT